MIDNKYLFNGSIEMQPEMNVLNIIAFIRNHYTLEREGKQLQQNTQPFKNNSWMGFESHHQCSSAKGVGAIRHYDTLSRFVLWWSPYQNYEIQLVKKIRQAVAQRTSMTHSSQVSQHKFSDQFCLTLIFCMYNQVYFMQMTFIH